MHLDRWPLALLIWFSILCDVTVARAGAKTCLTGTDPAVAADATQIVAVRSLIEPACPCTSFDGTKGKTHASYVACASRLIATEFDAGHLRRPCKGVVRAFYARSTCGFPVNPHHVVCIKRMLRSGHVSCAVKSTTKKDGTPIAGCAGVIGKFNQIACPDFAKCIDAADTNADLIIAAPGDSGDCNGCVNGSTQACYSGPPGTQGVGTCVAGNAVCSGGVLGECGGEVLPEQQDACVFAAAPYAASADRNCDGVLDRHAPTADASATATPGGTSEHLPPASGFTREYDALPLATLSFSASGSDEDNAAEEFAYAWRLLGAPSGNTSGLSGAPGAAPADVSTEVHPTLFASLVGDYAVELVLTDATGCQSAPASILIHVKPQESLLLELRWDQSVDMDLQLVEGATTAIFDSSACYWGRTSTTWGGVLEIDDLAGCNPEEISLASPPANGSTFGVYVHYYCNLRGHRFTDGSDTQAVCYETTSTSSSVPVTLRVFVDGVENSVFTQSMPPPGSNSSTWWKPATLLYSGGIWTIVPVNVFGTTSMGCAPTDGTSSCVCGDLPNCTDAFCGPGGAACRARYAFLPPTGPLCVAP